MERRSVANGQTSRRISSDFQFSRIRQIFFSSHSLCVAVQCSGNGIMLWMGNGKMKNMAHAIFHKFICVYMLFPVVLCMPTTFPCTLFSPASLSLHMQRSTSGPRHTPQKCTQYRSIAIKRRVVCCATCGYTAFSSPPLQRRQLTYLHTTTPHTSLAGCLVSLTHSHGPCHTALSLVASPDYLNLIRSFSSNFVLRCYIRAHWTNVDD